ncbi:MAG TPA: BrnA antitoxin family protein [Bryobacteraceae bacterium]|jgi:uncharacterized protein (DUF4415 family)|nr:BrnA antitoxin family protein [Bryobacteraceae bacterium]
MKTSSGKRLKISDETRALYAARDKSLDNLDPENPVRPPEFWENAEIGKFYRPIKTQLSFRVDNDVLEWLKSKGGGHLTRINEILRKEMMAERAT